MSQPQGRDAGIFGNLLAIATSCALARLGLFRSFARLELIDKDLFDSMAVPAEFTFDETDGRRTVVLSGDWTARGLFDTAGRLAEALMSSEGVCLDLSQINRCDTAGAYAIIRAADGRRSQPA